MFWGTEETVLSKAGKSTLFSAREGLTFFSNGYASGQATANLL